MRLRRGRRDQEEADQDQAKILKVFWFHFNAFPYIIYFQGMKDIAKDKNSNKGEEDIKAESLK